MHWYKKSKNIFKAASMTLYVKDFNYKAELNTLLDISYFIMQKVWKRIEQILDENEFEIWKNVKNDWLTPDGNDWDKSTGIINFYTQNIPKEKINQIGQAIKEEIEKIGLKVGNIKDETWDDKKELIRKELWKEHKRPANAPYRNENIESIKKQLFDISNKTGSRVLRIPIIENKIDKQNKPIEINMSNINAYHIFRDVLGYKQDLWENGEFDALELKKRVEYYLGETQILEHSNYGDEKLNEVWQKFNDPTPEEDWNKEKNVNNLADMLSGREGLKSRYTSEESKNRLREILNFCNWVLSNGYKTVYVA